MNLTFARMAKRLARRYTDGPTDATIPKPMVEASEIVENNNKKVFRKFPSLVIQRGYTVISGATHADDENGL